MNFLERFFKKPVQKQMFEQFDLMNRLTLREDFKEIAPTMSNYWKIYKTNTDIYRCVEEITQNCWMYWYRLLNWDSEVDDQDIRWLITPQFMKEVLQNYLIYWNVFIRVIRSPIGIARLQIIDPATVRIYYDKIQDVVVKYEYKIWNITFSDTPEIDWQKNFFHFWTTKDLKNKPWYLSTMQTILIEASTDYESQMSNFSQFKNNILPWAIISVDPNSSFEQVQDAVNQWKYWMQWGENKGKTSVVSFPIVVNKTNLEPKDMDYSKQRMFSTEKICSAYGVPKVILNYTNGVNYTNAEIQYGKFIENTIRPLEKDLQWWMQEIISEISELTFEIIDEHTNPMEERSAFAVEMLKNWIFTLNEARSYMWLEEANQEAKRIWFE